MAHHYSHPPKMAEIVKYCIPIDQLENYDHSWIKNEIIFHVKCADGLVILIRESETKEEETCTSCLTH